MNRDGCLVLALFLCVFGLLFALAFMAGVS